MIQWENFTQCLSMRSVNQMKGSWTASKMESERNVLIGNCHDVKTWRSISKISYFGCLKSAGSLSKCFSNSIDCKISIEKKSCWPSNTTGNYLFENIVQWEYLLGQRVSNQFKLQFVVKKTFIWCLFLIRNEKQNNRSTIPDRQIGIEKFNNAIG